MQTPGPPGQPPAIDRWTAAVTRWSARHAALVLTLALLVMGGSWAYASRLKIRGDFVELLPSHSETAKRFRAALARKGGSASTIVVVVSSPDADVNRKLVDAVEERVRKLPEGMVVSVEHGPGEVRKFYERWKWIFADQADLERIECELSNEKAKNLPGYLDLGEECDTRKPEEAAPGAPGAAPKPGDAPPKPKKEGSALSRFRAEMEARMETLDRYKTGYYRTDAGELYALVLRSTSAGMGDLGTDRLLEEVERIVRDVHPEQLHPAAVIGLGGDIPNANEERKALVEDITVVSTIAIGLIFASIIVYFRSFIALLWIGFCVTTGSGLAFAIAMASYGKLNAATSFLGSIVFGNGINYAIVYLARYQEVRRGGAPVEDALADAAVSCRRGTFLSALAASCAYGALLVTTFRGFREFGVIGASGMVLCWTVTFLALPAVVTTVERWRERRGASTAAPAATTESRLTAIFGRFIERRRVGIVVGGTLLTLAFIVPMPGYFKDPWEYDFKRLKSQSTRDSGAGRWSSKANEIFQSRGGALMVLADEPSEAPALAKAIRDRDAQRFAGKYVQKTDTLEDALGGAPEVVKEKLEVLGQIREHIDWLAPRAKTEEDRQLAVEWRPPDYLRPLSAADLPQVLVDKYREVDGRIGTPIFVQLAPGISQSDGHNLLDIADVLEGVRLPDGSVPANASRATVFAEMIRSLEGDSPTATLVAFLAVVLVTVLVTHHFASALAIIGSLFAGVTFTVGGAALLHVKLNFLNFVALPLTFGIGVEYAINVYERVRVSGDVIEGVRSVGGAVALCSITTIIGYAGLLFSDNQALQSLGRYAIMGEFACLGTALAILPAALRLRAPAEPQNASRAVK